MVWEMDQHRPADGGQPERMSPLQMLYLRFALSLIASIFLIFISITLHFEESAAPVFLRLLSLVLATVVILLLAGPFLENLKREFRERRFSLATLIFTGSGAAYLLSVWNTMSGETYFETSAMILTFYVGSLLVDTRIKRGLADYSRFWKSDSLPEVRKVVEDHKRGDTGLASESSGGTVAETASGSTGSGAKSVTESSGGTAAQSASGSTGSVAKSVKESSDEAAAETTSGSVFGSVVPSVVRTPVEALKKGDRCLTEAGQAVLFDARVAEGTVLMDESHLTGEPDPVRRKAGDTISAGSVSLDGGVLLEVLEPWHRSSLREYLERARAMRSRPGYYERLATRAASLLLAGVILASISGLIWYLVHDSLSTALKVYLAVLLIGCPCAFAISTPAALWVAHQRLHRTGIVAMGGSSALERLSGIRVVLFDKTGTLTEGVAIRKISRRTPYPDWTSHRLMRLAGGLEMDQTHPFARAVRRYLDHHDLKPLRVGHVEYLTGIGMRGSWIDQEADAKDGKDEKSVKDERDVKDEKKGRDERDERDERVVLLVNNQHPAASGRFGDSDFGLFLDGELLAVLSIYQPPRENLSRAIHSLKKNLGLPIAVVSGDPASPESVLPSEMLTGIDYHGGCSPEEKAGLVDHYRRKYGRVLFVGDGTNDLMAINRADLGVGVYTGSLSIRNNADFVLFHPDMKAVGEMLLFSRKIRQTIRINFFWAVVYNILGVGLALAGLLHPFFAILAMMLSSALVTIHALSLQYRQPELGDLEKEVNRLEAAELMPSGSTLPV